MISPVCLPQLYLHKLPIVRPPLRHLIMLLLSLFASSARILFCQHIWNPYDRASPSSKVDSLVLLLSFFRSVPHFFVVVDHKSQARFVSLIPRHQYYRSFLASHFPVSSIVQSSVLSTLVISLSSCTSPSILLLTALLIVSVKSNRLLSK